MGQHSLSRESIELVQNFLTKYLDRPSIVASLWIGPSAGRNFGIVTYAPFVGTPLFSYLYAFISASHKADDGSVCMGTRCWKTTFWITTATTVLGFVLTLILLRRRRDRV